MRESTWNLPAPEAGLRPWEDKGHTRELFDDLCLLIQASQAEEAIDQLLAGEPLSDERLASLGRLNYHAFIKRYEPIVALWDATPRLDPNAEALLAMRG